jgi:acetate kinase
LALSHLKVLGVHVDAALNAQHGDAATGRITQAGGVPAMVVATNEELMIARETLNVTEL